MCACMCTCAFVLEHVAVVYTAVGFPQSTSFCLAFLTFNLVIVHKPVILSGLFVVLITKEVFL